jgi:hypothetical protein
VLFLEVQRQGLLNNGAKRAVVPVQLPDFRERAPMPAAIPRLEHEARVIGSQLGTGGKQADGQEKP